MESPAATALRRRSNPMPISVPNYRRNTDRFQFGLLIDIASDSRSPSLRNADRHPSESALVFWETIPGRLYFNQVMLYLTVCQELLAPCNKAGLSAFCL